MLPGDVSPDQNTCGWMACTTSYCVVQRRPATERPPEEAPMTARRGTTRVVGVPQCRLLPIPLPALSPQGRSTQPHTGGHSGKRSSRAGSCPRRQHGHRVPADRAIQTTGVFPGHHPSRSACIRATRERWALPSRSPATGMGHEKRREHGQTAAGYTLNRHGVLFLPPDGRSGHWCPRDGASAAFSTPGSASVPDASAHESPTRPHSTPANAPSHRSRGRASVRDRSKPRALRPHPGRLQLRVRGTPPVEEPWSPPCPSSGERGAGTIPISASASRTPARLAKPTA